MIMDVKVKALKAHANEFGAKFEKAPDETYSLPEDHARLLAGQKTVEIVETAAKK